MEPRLGSAYRQLFIKGTRIKARILYGMYMSEEEPRTPEEIAADFQLSLEAVQEAIAYCASNSPEIQEDWEREEASIREMVRKNPNYIHPSMTHPPLSNP